MKCISTLVLTVLTLAPAALQALSVEESPVETKKSRRDDHTPPTWGIKTNLLYDATTTMNLGVEVRVGPKNSIELPVNWNPWSFNGGITKIKHILVQPEFRWWPQGTFRGNFFGLHGHWAFYNIGGLPHGPFTQYMKEHRFQGWLAGAGVSWGYRWNFNHHWALEITYGIGYHYLEYGKYACGECGELLEQRVKHFFGPTRAGVTLILGLGSKRKPVPVVIPEPEPVIPEPEPEPEPVVIYQPRLAAVFVTPEAEPVKARRESGRAYIEFAVGRSLIVPDFRGNRAELQKIYDMVERVSGDPDATITGITIIGNASPEGSYSTNLSLSNNRAAALREHIAIKYRFDGRIMQSRGDGEDWKMLDTLVGESDIPEKQRLLDVIRSNDNYDMRERRLIAMMGGVPYRRVKSEIYPRLRRTDYLLDFEVAPIGIDRGREVLRTRPGNLSLNEMFLIANTFEPGSEQFNEVFDIAARVYPDSDVANINAAASALGRGDAISAARYLDKVAERSAAYLNNCGVLAWMQGDGRKAAGYFAASGSEGASNRAEMDKHLQSVNDASTQNKK